jgi:hypothetical protein
MPIHTRKSRLLLGIVCDFAFHAANADESLNRFASAHRVSLFRLQALAELVPVT